MKGTCSLSHLLHALQDAIGLLSAKEAGVVGTHGLLRAHGQHLSLSIHHPSAGLTHTCPASISQEGVALVPLKPLLALCKESKGEQISFQHNAKTHDLVLQQANGKMKLQGNNPADYPEFSTDPFVPLATMSSHQHHGTSRLNDVDPDRRCPRARAHQGGGIAPFARACCIGCHGPYLCCSAEKPGV